MYGKVKSNLLVILNEDNEFVNDYKSDIEIMKLKIEHIDLILTVFKINWKLYAFKETNGPSLTEEEITKCIKDLSKNEIIEASDFDEAEGLIESLSVIEDEIKPVKLSTIRSFVEGTSKIWVPAVYCVIKSFFKAAKMIYVNFNYLKRHHDESNFKRLLVLTNNISKIFDFLVYASVDDENDILYNPSLEDVKTLMSIIEYSEPNDLADHKIKSLEGISHFDYYCAVASKAFKSTNIIEQIGDCLSWAMYYKNKKQMYIEDGEFAK